jgi:hypothetical protein
MKEGTMAEHALTLSDQERRVLLELLDEMLKETKIEEHRTRNLSYRQFVVEREKALESVLNKLRQPTA